MGRYFLIKIYHWGKCLSTKIFTLSAQRGIIKLSKEVDTMLVAAFAFYSAVISFLANSYALIRQRPLSLFFIIPIFIFVNVFAVKMNRGMGNV